MKTTLTRNQLIKAQNAFDCEDWKKSIREILNSTKDESIEIQDKYLNLIKEEATWVQILYCKALNLDLKWNLPVKAKEFVLEKMKGCEVVKIGEFRTLYQENGKTLFTFDLEYKEIWFEYDEIYEVLEEKYYLKYNEINEIMNCILEEHFKIKGYTPPDLLNLSSSHWKRISN